MESWIFICVLAVILVGGIVVFILDQKKAESMADVVANLPDFNPNDIFVSTDDFSGVAIDVDRLEIALLEGALFGGHEIRRFKFSSIISCEILQDGMQLAYANRGSQIAGVAVGGALLGGVGAVIGGLSGSKRHVKRVRMIILRFVTDDFDMPNHDVLIFKSLNSKGESTESVTYKEALKVGELWHSRVRAMMKAA